MKSIIYFELLPFLKLEMTATLCICSGLNFSIYTKCTSNLHYVLEALEENECFCSTLFHLCISKM